MSKWSEWKENLGDSRPWHILEKERIIQDQSIIDKRMEICRACPEFLKLTNRCNKCGCVMPLKTKIRQAECPIGKWGQEPL